MLKARRDWGSRIGKQMSQSTLHNPYAAVDGIRGGPRFLAGLEANVVQKGRAGESLLGMGAGNPDSSARRETSTGRIADAQLLD